MAPNEAEKSCRSCRRPIFWYPNVGWLHDDLLQYINEENTCQSAHPVSCRHARISDCPHGWV